MTLTTSSAEVSDANSNSTATGCLKEPSRNPKQHLKHVSLIVVPDRYTLLVMLALGESRNSGIETQIIEGVPVRVYGPAKTVADCFKFRNKVGIDIAVDALRDCLGQRRCTTNELFEYARVCRVSRVMRPYVEALT